MDWTTTGQCPCSPMTLKPGFVISFDQSRLIVALNNAYRDVVRKHNIPFLDSLTPLLTNKDYMEGLKRGDKMHCDENGYEITAQMINDRPIWKNWFK